MWVRCVAPCRVSYERYERHITGMQEDHRESMRQAREDIARLTQVQSFGGCARVFDWGKLGVLGMLLLGFDYRPHIHE